MKRMVKACFGFLMIGASCGSVYASPMYYTFTGTATDVIDTASASGISVGDEIFYTYLIDFDRGGRVTNLDGVERSVVDSFSTYENYAYNPNTMDHFYVDYIAGSAYFGVSGVLNDFLELNTGLNNDELGKYMITGGDAVGIASFLDPVQSWTVGDSFYSLNAWGDSGDRIGGLITLTGITAVPAPTPLALVGLGMLGIFASRTKCRKVNSQ